MILNKPANDNYYEAGLAALAGCFNLEKHIAERENNAR